MSDSKIEQMYEQMRAYIRSTVELEFLKQKPETRSAPEPKVIEGPAGKDGVNGKDGVDGKDGVPGKAGENGIATREEIEQVVERKVADINVRTFADIYRGVYKPGDLYTRGVLTTWGGSLWLSLNDTKTKPGETPDWKLVVKK